MPEISVRMSRKAAGDKPDSAKAVQGRKPDLDRVTGQAATTVSIVCWNCWAVNEVLWDPSQPFTFVCWNCGTVATI